jgi:yecA family protein
MMKPTNMPEYNEITSALAHTELKLHASQVHGLISGVLCGDLEANREWEELVMGEKLTDQTRPILQSLYENTKSKLADFLFEFQLLIPVDEDELPLRAEALGVWCQGFLTGLQATGVAVTDREPGELTEAIQDLVEIAKMNYDEVEVNEEDEAAYEELVEYVRVAVIFIYQDLRGESDVHEECSHADHLH